MKKILKYVFSYLSALAIACVGIVAGEMLRSSLTALVVLSVVSVLPALFLAFNILATGAYAKKLNRKKVGEMQNYFLKHRNEAEKTEISKLKLLKRMKLLSDLCAVAIGVCACAAAFLGGALYSFSHFLFGLLLIYSGFAFFTAFSRIRRYSNVSLDGNSGCVDESQYPHLYSLARRAASELNCCDEIKILLSSNVNASIMKENKRYVLVIGAMLVNILTEDELYHILLHEFSHVTADTKTRQRERDYRTWLDSRYENASKLEMFVYKFFIFIDTLYVINYMLYDYATSVMKETNADLAMAKYGTPKVAASALLKLYYHDMYMWESNVKDEPSIFESEILLPNCITNELKSFRTAVEKRQQFWNELASKEILPNNATHPIFRMRLDTLGVNEIKIVESSSSEEYLAEREKILEHAENLIYEDRKESYENDRNENYLKPMARIEEWIKNGSPISHDTYVDLVQDLRCLGRNEEAEALCDRAMAELSEQSAFYAAYMKGCALIHRHDENGVEYIYRAIENNSNFLEEGLNMIGSFLCYTGREEELLEYRKRAVELSQRDVDENSQAGFLKKGDDLTKEELPDGMLEDILSFMLSIDEGLIKNIYLVRKTVSENFFTSAFVIHFWGGTDEKRNEIMHKIFRFLDAYPIDWQFSLFDYFDYPEIKVEKIEGSLVYTKKEETN